ncbi:MAG: hypothetical protein DLM54_05475 [Acidimicrobiales bacterium]|nr:MAG: hypothetical protein DLM54_05475 [Acidimicrobiales bacterium]
MELKVGPEDLGTDERSWRAGDLLDGLTPFEPGGPGRVLVVAPHPDDAVLGVGGLLQQLDWAGWVVDMVAVTDGEASHPRSTRITPDALVARRSQERDVAFGRLGVRPVRVSRLGLPDGAVSEREGDLRQALGERLDTAGPGGRLGGAATLCLVPWRHDGHPDHDAVGRAGAAACADRATALVEYLVWAWHWATPSSGDIPWSSARRVDLSRPDLARKRWATRAFVTQVTALGPDPGDTPPLPAAVLTRFRRPFEVVLV